MNVLIAGGSGFIGKALCQHLYDLGHNVSVLTRNTFSFSQQGITPYYWNVDTQTIDFDAFKDVDAVINLAGANIAEKPWTASQKLKIQHSRVAATELLYNTIKRLSVKPKVFIAASAVGFYGFSNNNRVMTEMDQHGSDFLAQVCNQWELKSNQFNNLGIRTCIVRTGIVLSKKGGALPKMTSSLNVNLLVRMGSGKQPFPWIALEDLCHIYQFLLETPLVSGVFNAVAPQQNDFNSLLLALKAPRKIKPFTITLKPFLLHLIMGEMASMLLEGSFVSGAKIEQSGFKFKHPSLQTFF